MSGAAAGAGSSAGALRVPSLASALVLAVFGDLRGLVANRAAFRGAIVGSVALAVGGFGLAKVSAALAPSTTEEQGDPELELDFDPGALVKLGRKIDPAEVPQKIVTQDAAPPPEAAQETLTKDDSPPPPDTKPKLPKTDSPPPPETSSKLPSLPKPNVGPTNTEANTPFNDKATVDYNVGDPFGTNDGWAQMAKDGDPWATAVMGALNKMPVGAYAAKAGAGRYMFQVSVCKDGTLQNVLDKGGDLPDNLKGAVKLELSRLKVPKPPEEVASKMTTNCSKIRYTFVWSASGVK